MDTISTRDDGLDREELVAALRLLATFYSVGASDTAETREAKMVVASGVTAYAMGQLLKRLVAEGYVLDSRRAELLERAANLEAGRGFVTNEPATAPPATSKPKRTTKPPTPTPAAERTLDDELRDMLP